MAAKAKKKNRSLAAKKGWAARRKRLAFQKRSAAAKKGWKKRKAVVRRPTRKAVPKKPVPKRRKVKVKRPKAKPKPVPKPKPKAKPKRKPAKKAPKPKPKPPVRPPPIEGGPKEFELEHYADAVPIQKDKLTERDRAILSVWDTIDRHQKEIMGKSLSAEGVRELERRLQSAEHEGYRSRLDKAAREAADAYERGTLDREFTRIAMKYGLQASVVYNMGVSPVKWGIEA